MQRNGFFEEEQRLKHRPYLSPEFNRKKNSGIGE